MKLITYTGIYDNPQFMRREYWYKSKLYEWISATLICQKSYIRLPKWGTFR